MDVTTLKEVLEANAEKRIAFLLPNSKLVPLHFHITELGLVTKEFVDCGGVRRSAQSCMLQIWVANDTEHVLRSAKLAEILSHADKLGISGSDLVECEYQSEHLNIFQLSSYEVNEKAVVFQLTNKETACLSPDKCGIDEFGNPVAGCC